MAAEMMNGGVSQPTKLLCLCPWILIAKVASHCSEFSGKQAWETVEMVFGKKKWKRGPQTCL